MTTTATTTSPLFAELHAVHAFIRAHGDNLPEPSGVTVYSFGNPTAHLQFDSLADLAAWAEHFGVEVTAHDHEPAQQVHHRASAEWSGVSFDMVFVEHVATV